jgi:hypothetical protein
VVCSRRVKSGVGRSILKALYNQGLASFKGEVGDHLRWEKERAMRLKVGVKVVLLLGALVLTALPTGGVSQTRAVLPNPVLSFIGPEYYETGGKQWTRYRYEVVNADAYPNELFAAAPALPPCGNNTKAARTWVDLYDGAGKRLYGFCALGSPSDLGKIWFALERDALPPSWIYVELNDRQTSTKYKSNLAETVQ